MSSLYLKKDFENLKSELEKTEIGSLAPDFVLDDETGKKWRLSEHLGKVVALIFYPQNETLVCTKQLCSLRDNWAEYLESKAVVVGISPASKQQHSEFSNKHRLPLPLLADAERQITKKFIRHWFFPVSFVRGVVVIDAEGFIRSKRIMLRAFRPADRSVITAIHAARADALYADYESITNRKTEELLTE